MNFELPLAEEKVKRHQVIALHLIVSFTLIASGVIALLFRYFIDRAPDDTSTIFDVFNIPKWLGYTIFAFGFLLLFTVIGRSKWLTERKTNRTVRVFELLIVLCLASYAVMYGLRIPVLIYGLVSAALLYGIFSEGIADATLYVHISGKGIRLPASSRKRFLEWKEVEQVLFRFGILTIDCHDNRLYQWNLKHGPEDAELFQRFCNEQVAAGHAKRSKNDW